MSNRTDKPKLTSKQLVIKMRDEKGITFKYDSLDDAADYLTDKNNYLRLACYRTSFDKHNAGARVGKYIDLDFAYLKELSVLDRHYRSLMEDMCSDIEHSLGVMLLKLIEQDISCDGYDIVKSFLDNNPYVVDSIEHSSKSPHTGDLIQKYFSVTKTKDPYTGRTKSKITAYDDCPAWVLKECLTFGHLISFYQYYCNQSGITPIVSNKVFNIVRSLRNGASHNSCLFCNIPPKSAVPPREIINAVTALGIVTTSQRQRRLSSRTALEFTGLLYLYSVIVHGSVRTHRVNELYELFNGRMLEKKAFFKNNDLIIATYDFAHKMITGFLPK